MSINRYLEIELKFTVEDSTTVPDLQAIDGVNSLSAPQTQDLDAVYFDTEDFRLGHAKITLRRRTGGEDPGWHIKLPGKTGRQEIQAQLSDSENAETPPPLIADQVLAITRGKPLHPIARVRNRRELTFLLDEDGNPVAEFCDDHVETESFLPGGTTRHWREWELELTSSKNYGDHEAEFLQSAAKVLVDAGAVKSSSPSKLLTAVGDFPENAPIPNHIADLPEDSPESAVLSALAKDIAKIIKYDPKVRADEFDAIHQMRVGTRELRSHMETFEEIFQGEEYRQLESELKILANVLGRARDAEVISERISDSLTELDSTVRNSATDEAVKLDLDKAYAREFRKVINALRSPRYLDLLNKLERLLSHPPLAVETRAKPLSSAKARENAGTVLLKHLDKAFRKVVKLDRLARKEWHDDSLSMHVREANLHKVRKAVKKLRYSAEAGGSATDLKVKKLYKHCSQVQSLLGDFQDAVTSRDAVHKMAKHIHRQGIDTFELGIIYQQEHELSRQYLDHYPHRMMEIEKSYKKLRKQVKKMST